MDVGIRKETLNNIFFLVSIVQFAPAGKCCNYTILLQKASFFSVEGYSEVAAHGDKMHATYIKNLFLLEMLYWADGTK